MLAISPPGRAMNKPFDMTAALQIRRTESLTTLVRRELERMIEMGELKAGDRINENALAQKIGVSRGPIREACRGLEQSGLVTVVVNRGVIVREIGNKEAAELYDIRARLMGLAGFTAASRITRPQVRTLREMVARMADAVAANELNRYYPINLRFHSAIAEFSGNERLTTMYTAIEREMHLFRRKTLDMPGRMESSNAEHARIVDALEAQDAARVEREMMEHVLTSRRALFD
jgi:DNA-binding GntR family transcriptional regulator